MEKKTLINAHTDKPLVIVLTGGPSAGKSTILEQLANIAQEGVHIIRVDESATQLINRGINPDLGAEEFQRFVLSNQIHNEELAIRAASQMTGTKVIIIDRGILDGECYVSSAEKFEELLAERGLTKASAVARYDAVLFLETCAIGAPEAYQWNKSGQDTCNNPARSEPPEEAIAKNNLTLKAWESHPLLYTFENKDFKDFDAKVSAVIDSIHRLIKEVS